MDLREESMARLRHFMGYDDDELSRDDSLAIQGDLEMARQFEGLK